MKASSKAARAKPPPKRRRRISFQRAVVWAIIILFALSIVGGIVVIGASVSR